MADELTDYLMGGSLYRQMMIRTPEGMKQPKMTIGALLENLEALQWQREALNLSSGRRWPQSRSGWTLAATRSATSGRPCCGAS